MQEIPHLWETHRMSNVCCDRMGVDKGGIWFSAQRMSWRARIIGGLVLIRAIRTIGGYGLLSCSSAGRLSPSRLVTPCAVDRPGQSEQVTAERYAVELASAQVKSHKIKPPQTKFFLFMYAQH